MKREIQYFKITVVFIFLISLKKFLLLGQNCFSKSLSVELFVNFAD